jgi:hypothetical protein
MSKSKNIFDQFDFDFFDIMYSCQKPLYEEMIHQSFDYELRPAFNQDKTEIYTTIKKKDSDDEEIISELTLPCGFLVGNNFYLDPLLMKLMGEMLSNKNEAIDRMFNYTNLQYSTKKEIFYKYLEKVFNTFKKLFSHKVISLPAKYRQIIPIVLDFYLQNVKCIRFGVNETTNDFTYLLIMLDLPIDDRKIISHGIVLFEIIGKMTIKHKNLTGGTNNNVFTRYIKDHCSFHVNKNINKIFNKII